MIDAEDKNGNTPLHLSALQGQIESLTVLSEAGADIGAVNSEYETALHFAVLSGNEETIDYLYCHNANPLAKTKRGKTPIDYAHKNKDRVVKILSRNF